MEFNDEKLNQIATVAYSFRETVYHTYDCALAVMELGIEGEFVECGCANGAQVMAMQKAKIDFLDRLNGAPRILAFDSFEGIPLASTHDAEQPGIGKIMHDATLPERDRLVSSGITVHSLENVLSTFDRFDIPTNGISFIKGWFQDTLPEKAPMIESISLLRLDGDLYESTMVCLDYLYPKVSVGGVVVVDDFALPGCAAAVRDYFEKIGETFPEMIEVEGSGGVVHFIKK